MKYNSETKLIISASKRPGNFGTKLYNQIFDDYDINAVYLSRFVTCAQDLMVALKTFQCHGCSVSMPLKSEVIPYLHNLDPLAEKLHSVNTLLRVSIESKDQQENFQLYGFNTDYIGALKVLAPYQKEFQKKQVLIYGTGSVVNTISAVLINEFQCQVCIAGRNTLHVQQKIEELHALRANPECFYPLVVNCTPCDQEIPSNLIPYIKNSQIFFHLPVEQRPSPLINKFQSQYHPLAIIEGKEMFIFQFQKQFEIYTGQHLSEEEIRHFYQRCIQ